MNLQFFGAAQEVTGSCFLLSHEQFKVLVDCGLYQGDRQSEERNSQPFPFNPAEVDAVILSHAHLDHSGRLPLLVKQGFRGPIYTQRATRDLCRIMLKDAAYLNEKETEWENRKRERKGLKLLTPLYTQQDVNACMRQFKVIDYDQKKSLMPGVELRLRDAGHILGSAILEIWLSQGELTRKLVFSGDLGHHHAPILRNPTIVDQADLVIMESTYGDRQHRSWQRTWDELHDVLQQAQTDGGNILIPAFAVGRTQELLYAFTHNFQQWQMQQWTLFLDSPLAIEATQVYARHPDLYDMETVQEQRLNGSTFMPPNLHLSRTANQSMAINRISSGALIIAGSGMCEGGRIKHHLKHNIWRRNCNVIIVGFQARGTLGRQLVDGAKHIRLWGETVQVAARIHTIGGFSAHADQSGLLNWYQEFHNRPPLVLIHGEEEAQKELQQKIKTNLNVDAHIAQPGHRLDLYGMRWLHNL